MDKEVKLPSDGELARLLWLNAVPRVGPAAARMLLKHYQTLDDIVSARDYQDVPGLRPHMAEELYKAPKALDAFERQAEQILSKVTASGITILTPLDPAYPPQLLNPTSYAPTILYVLGDPACLGRTGGAIVGTRSPSTEAKTKTIQAATRLAQSGQTVFSGMAKGIDAAAHCGALDAGGSTVAVLGCGVDRVYPAENAELYRRIRTGGAILSEYVPGTPPSQENLRRRNRLIVGLSHFVMVAECPTDSGAMIAARAALQQQRALLVLKLITPGFERERSGTGVLAQSDLAAIWDGLDLEWLRRYVDDYTRPASAEARLDKALGKEPKSGARKGTASITDRPFPADQRGKMTARRSTIAPSPGAMKVLAPDDEPTHSVKQQAIPLAILSTPPPEALPERPSSIDRSQVQGGSGEAESSLIVGMRVRHPTFGAGIVKGIDKDVIELKFDADKKRSRTFMLNQMPTLERLTD